MLKNLIFYSTVLELKRGENIYSFIFPLLPTCFFYFLSENLKKKWKIGTKGLTQSGKLLTTQAWEPVFNLHRTGGQNWLHTFVLWSSHVC